jgi:ArsR family transcriptional regulator, arsenate/arsenite/antimonite-responsive transcriptional repressor
MMANTLMIVNVLFGESMATKSQTVVATPITSVNVCCVPLRTDLVSEDQAVVLASAFSALADPARVRLLNLIATAPGGEACACDLAEPIGKSQPTVSHHLKILTDAGLITREKRGIWAWYRANAEAIEAMRASLGL